MTVKPVEEMTREEVADELARVRAERAEINAAPLPEPELLVKEEAEARLSEAMGFTETEDTPEDEEEAPAPAPWPHLTMEFGGRTLEVRKPDESALIAISMTGTPGLSPQTQMSIFTKFLANHLSPESFVVVVEAMTDPESGVNIQRLITALTKL